MKHAFSNITSDGLIAALMAMANTERVVDCDEEQAQIVTIGRHNVSGDWVINVSDAADGDTTSGEGLNHRTYSSPDFSHAVYSALVDHPEAMAVFKESTGWTA